MLRRLTIEHYGLIRKAEIDFAGGATMFTGETGSGKTMVLGALAFVLGERASSDVVRPGAARAAVSLEFEPSASLATRLRGDGFDFDEGEDAIVSREIAEGGKSTLRVNGRPATAAYVRDFAALVADVAGQHEAQRLLAPSYHLDLLDRYAEAGDLRERVRGAYERLGELEKSFERIERDDRRAHEELVFARFALGEIEAANLQPGEDERLTGRRRYLENVERIALALRNAHEALAGEEASASDALGVAAAALDAVAPISPALAQAAERARGLQSEASDLALSLGRELEETEFDPNELEEINARLASIDALKRKYGATIDAVLARAAEFRSTVDLYDHREERREAMLRERDAARSGLLEEAKKLTAVREKAARKLEAAVVKELRELALPNAQFGVRLEPRDAAGAHGAEDAEFLFAANKGETLRPLARVASGGELSRVLLAVVVVLAGARDRTALVFDEIDAGIGGATGTAVGMRLGRLAALTQVVCVTHLAQIASWADAHYVLEKRESRSGTEIGAVLVDDGVRAEEIARMLSGEKHDAALEHARTLLAQTSQRRLTIAAAG